MRALRNPFGSLPPEVLVLDGVSFCVALGFGIVAPALLSSPSRSTCQRPRRPLSSACSRSSGSSRRPRPAGSWTGWASARARPGLSIVAVSSALAGLSTTYLQLLTLRGIGGFGSAMFTVSSMGLLLRVVAPEMRGRALGAYQGGFLLGGVAGPAVGGSSPGSRSACRSSSTPRPWASPTRGHDVPRPHGTREHQGGAPPRGPRLRSDRAAQLGTTGPRSPTTRRRRAVFGVRSSIIPLFVVEGLRLSPSWTGVGLVLSAVVQALVLIPAGRLVDTRGRRPFLRAGAAVVLAARGHDGARGRCAALPGRDGAVRHRLGVARRVLGGHRRRRHRRTGRHAGRRLPDGLGRGAFLGPLVAGLLADTASFEVAFLATAAVSGLAFATTLVMPETRRVQPVP